MKRKNIVLAASQFLAASYVGWGDVKGATCVKHLWLSEYATRQKIDNGSLLGFIFLTIGVVKNGIDYFSVLGNQYIYWKRMRVVR